MLSIPSRSLFCGSLGGVRVAVLLAATALGVAGCANAPGFARVRFDLSRAGLLPPSLPPTLKLVLSVRDDKIQSNMVIGDMGCLKTLFVAPGDFDADEGGVVIKITPGSDTCSTVGKYYLVDIPNIRELVIGVDARLIENPDLKDLPTAPDRIQITVVVRNGIVASHRINNADARTIGLKMAAVTDSIPRIAKIYSDIYAEDEWLVELPTKDGISIVTAEKRRRV